MKYVSNIFRILNVDKLTAEYCLFEIKGLRKNKEYQANKQFLIDKLSRSLKHPVTIIEVGDEPRLVVKNDPDIVEKISKEQDFGRIYIHLKQIDQSFKIDFVNPSPEVKQICIRFLQFDLNSELRKNWNLWQPYTGGPFFLKEPQIADWISIFKGFVFRVIALPEGGFGVIIDATRKFSSVHPLPHYLPKSEFYRHYRKKSFIYQYSSWYEIQPQEYDDFNVSEFKVGKQSLIEFIRNEIPKPHSNSLANLPADSAVLTYYTKDGETRGAPAGMLYEVLDFKDTQSAEINRKVLIDPQQRFNEIVRYRNQFFTNLKFGKTTLEIDNRAVELPTQDPYYFPHLEFGNGFILKASMVNSAKEFAKERMNQLLNRKVGFFTETPLGDQIFVIPRSINDTCAGVFTKDLKAAVNEMYPADSYDPQIIPYEDKFKNGTDYLTIGRFIIQAIKDQYHAKGKAFGVVMIPRLEKKSKRDHDKLAALIIRELRSLELHIAIIHTDVVNTSFEWHRSGQSGQVTYSIKQEKARRYNGYIKNIAINKVLLNCNKWPFILHKPLHADLVIGIDVKHHTAGFVIVDKYGRSIRPMLDETSNKERLSESQLKRILYQIIKEEFSIEPDSNIQNILIIRDGRLFDTELSGLEGAFEKLKQEGVLSPTATLNIVEIPKTSYLSVRFFAINWDNNSKNMVVENAPNGLHLLLNQEAFVCTTGREFIRDGTCNPLYLKFTNCSMPAQHLMEDIYDLTALAFTKPDDCSRVPLPIKINDIKLSNAASEYDEDAYRAVETLFEDLNLTTDE